MGFSQGSKTIDLDSIFSNVREFDILSHYLGISSVPCIINSPLRVDKNPSFGLWTKDENRIFYRDFATKEKGDIFSLFEQLWKTDYAGVVNQIYKDLPKIHSNKGKIKTLDGARNHKTYDKDTILECKTREWREYDLKYWEQYGISLKWLKFGDIYPISYVILTKSGNRYDIPAEKYAYAYVERKDDNISLKIYQPFSEKFKWSNKHDGSVWDLWTKLPKEGEELIITSSRKDALCIWENTGIPSLSLQAESYLPKHHVVQQLKERFKIIYVLYDNDFKSDINYGQILGKSMATEFDLIQLEIPNVFESKDTSDLCKNFNRTVVKEVILRLINNSKNIYN